MHVLWAMCGCMHGYMYGEGVSKLAGCAHLLTPFGDHIGSLRIWIVYSMYMHSLSFE